MFDKNSLKTTALAMCGAFIIGISSGTAQASVAEQNLIAKGIETVSNDSLPKNFISSPPETLRQRKERLEHERKYERDRNRFYRDHYRDKYDRHDRRDRRDRRDDYRRPEPPPPPGRGNYGPPPPPR